MNDRVVDVRLQPHEGTSETATHSNATVQHRTDFNPTRVRLKHERALRAGRVPGHFNPTRVRLKPDKPVSGFDGIGPLQPHEGTSETSAPIWFDIATDNFNPTRVRLKRDGQSDPLRGMWYFNPTRVRLKLRNNDGNDD